MDLTLSNRGAKVTHMNKERITEILAYNFILDNPPPWVIKDHSKEGWWGVYDQEGNLIEGFESEQACIEFVSYAIEVTEEYQKNTKYIVDMLQKAFNEDKVKDDNLDSSNG